MERSLHTVNKNMSDQCDSAASSSASSAELLADSRKQREMLENELRRVRGQLEASHKVGVERELGASINDVCKTFAFFDSFPLVCIMN